MQYVNYLKIDVKYKKIIVFKIILTTIMISF